MDYKHIVVLTGAGVSAESGIPTFRGPDGLWEGHRVEDVATHEAVTNDLPGVNAFFNKLRRGLPNVAPNPAHHALAAWEKACDRASFTLVTQNIDPLHQLAGSQNVVPMHGELLSVLCNACGATARLVGDVEQGAPCPHCGAVGTLRPDIVLFGEMPYQMDKIVAALCLCDLFVAIGTSGVVYPAAGFVDLARRARAHTVEINPAETARSAAFDERLTGPAGVAVPDFVARMMGVRD